MKRFADVFRIYRLGRLTVVGFPGEDLPDYERSQYGCMELQKLLSSVRCETLAVDLTAAEFIPSSILGLLVSFRKSGADVIVFNPSSEVRRTLDVTRLDRYIHVGRVDLRSSAVAG
jgi:anti-anti-sigma factor